MCIYTIPTPTQILLYTLGISHVSNVINIFYTILDEVTFFFSKVNPMCSKKKEDWEKKSYGPIGKKFYTTTEMGVMPM